MRPSTVRAGEIGYVEQFALAADREAALAQLIPGTEDYYYYHCLHWQNVQQFDRVEDLLTKWVARHNVTARVREIRHRQALLRYPLDPQASLRYLRETLGLTFDHQRETVDQAADLPTSFDAGLISPTRLRELALQRHGNLNGFEDSALPWLAGTELSPEHRRELLSRLPRPDLTSLVDLVVADLEARDSAPFGSQPIHAQLLRAQLDELVRRKPNLRNETAFVNTYLSKLAPNADTDVQADVTAYQQYLESLWQFVGRLSDAHNSLKAHVLYHRLALDVRRGQFDKARLLAYLKLPRDAHYVNPRYNELPNHRNALASLGQDFQPVTRLQAIGDDEPVVRQYLQHFLRDEPNYSEYQALISDDYLKPLFAETKIVNGLGNPEQWSSLLSPSAYQALRDRVDLDFAPTNPLEFGAQDEVAFDVLIKNVPTLIVKVYRINALNYYQDLATHVNTNINLDGLVANRETTTKIDESPFRRISRRYSFPELSDPGIYVIDFIGNGKSSRALVHKGRLTHVVRTTAAGHAFTVLNEKQQALPAARIWMNGTEYTAGSQGEILIPFTAEPQERAIVLLHDKLVSLARFNHLSENYQFLAGIHCELESLRSRRVAPLLVRAQLTVNGSPVSLGALESIALDITSTDHDGVSTTAKVTDLELSDEGDILHELRIPPRVSQLSVQITAVIKQMSTRQPLTLAASKTFQINGIDKTHTIESAQLGQNQDGYLLEVLGRTGEPKSSRPVRVKLKHRDFRDLVEVMLRSSNAGQVQLGPLPGVTGVWTQVADGPESYWDLTTHRYSYSREHHARVGETIQVPYSGPAQTISPADFSLLELRGGTFFADHLGKLKLHDGSLWIEDLSAGDYELQLKDRGAQITLRVTAGVAQAGFAVGPVRALELRDQRPLHIKSAEVTDQRVRVTVANANRETRVHVYGVAFRPTVDAYSELQQVLHPEPLTVSRPRLPSYYVQGRQLGDEFRYVLERKYAVKFPGNMLTRPELLLNPWDVRDTQTETEQLVEGDEFAPSAPPAAMADALAAAQDGLRRDSGSFTNFDFLPGEALIMLNAVPDADGVVELDLDTLQGIRCLYVVAVDATTADQRVVVLPETPRKSLDLRLTQGLDPTQHFALEKQTRKYAAQQLLQVGNVGSGRFQLYDSLPKVYQLYETLLPNTHLKDFRFVLEWPKLSAEERRAKYSQYACHELNFFLSRKDPEFFATVVRPYLAHKLHKTFMDDYLLENDLQDYLSPWNYEHLNTVERVLLAKRIDGELARTLSFLENQWQILPTDQDHLNFLFDTSMFGEALAAETAVATRAAMGGMGSMDSGAALPMLRAEEAAPEGEATDAAANEPTDRAAWSALSKRRRFAAPRAAGRPGRGAEGRESQGIDRYYANIELREQLADQQPFRTLDQTKEWAENNYYRMTQVSQNADLVPPNDFWIDVARHSGDGEFLSEHFASAARNFTEALLALSLLDLPFTSPEHAVEAVDQAMRITTAGPVIALHEQIEAATNPTDAVPILVSQNFFRDGERSRMVNGETVDLFVRDEFLKQTVYGCQLVVSNPTSSRQKLDVLQQLPVGAVPVGGSKTTQTVRLLLEPYQTQTLEYYFYFPLTGKFAQFPVHVTRNAQLVAAAPAVNFSVVDTLSQIDRQSWDYVSQHGTADEVLNYLRTQNLQAIAPARIAFRMQDAGLFHEVTRILRERHRYDHVLWSYSVLHNDPASIHEFLEHSDAFAAECGELLRSPLLLIDPVARITYEHFEYHPLVNARAHQIGQQRQILNDRFHAQYHQWLKLLTYERDLDAPSRLATIYYLLLQDRLEDALQHFGKVDRSSLATQLQYDYCQAYLALSQADTALAGSIADRYTNYPVDRWRQRFDLIRNHLAEIDGQATVAADATDRNQAQDQSAAGQPSLEFEVQDKALQLTYRNLEKCEIRYYLMDLELLFSRNPFVQQHQGQFAYIAPNSVESVTLETTQGVLEHPLPATLHNQNVLIEVEAAGQRRSKPYYSNALTVQLVEKFGQLRVTHGGEQQPLAKVYCKVYALLEDGSTVFYKDGYTDLRGRFDYATLSTNRLDTVKRFAILVMSDDQGATVREVDPPQR